MTRLLTIMGSGETAPTMVKAHRSVLDRLSSERNGELESVFLDTPFGFQENAADLSAKTLDYFRTSLRQSLHVAGLERIDAMGTVEREAAYARVHEADFVFAGPGSPTYALRQWIDTPMPQLLREKLRTNGAVTFASAAALTLGVRTAPIYEIYKAGFDPFWLDGMDVMSSVDLNVVVIPHYNNAEGGHHDTRFCYLGERRLRVMEEMLPAGTFVLGVDEHTGVIIDLDADTATTVGLGVLSVRRNGATVEFPSGETIPMDVLRGGGAAGASAKSSPPVSVGTVVVEPDSPSSLIAAVDALQARFDRGFADGDAKAALAAVLELEQAIVDWSANTTQSDEVDRARAALRSMIVRLGEAAVDGLTDKRGVLAPLVAVALRARSGARDAKRYDLSDQIRDDLAAAGVELRDTPAGPEWDLSAPNPP